MGKTGGKDKGKAAESSRAPSNKRSRSEAFRGGNTFSSEFVTQEGRDRYARLTLPFVHERGIQVTPGAYPWLDEIVNDQGWGEFIKEPNIGYAQIVKEFYSNFPDMQDGRVFVRRVWVPVTPASINQALGLENVEPDKDAYRKLLLDPPSIEELVDRLCVTGTDSGEITRKKRITLKTIDRVASFVLHWVGARIMPTSYFTEFSFSRAQFIFAISECRVPIDVGRIIYDEMAKPPKSSMGFPQLITQMCLEAGVKVKDVDTVIKPMKPITNSIIVKYGGDVISDDENIPRQNIPRQQSRTQKEITEELEREFVGMKVNIREIREEQRALLASHRRLEEAQHRQEEISHRQEEMGRHILRALRFLAERGDMTGFPTIPGTFFEAGRSSGPPDFTSNCGEVIGKVFPSENELAALPISNLNDKEKLANHLLRENESVVTSLEAPRFQTKQQILARRAKIINGDVGKAQNHSNGILADKIPGYEYDGEISREKFKTLSNIQVCETSHRLEQKMEDLEGFTSEKRPKICNKPDTLTQILVPKQENDPECFPGPTPSFASNARELGNSVAVGGNDVHSEKHERSSFIHEIIPGF